MSNEEDTTKETEQQKIFTQIKYKTTGKVENEIERLLQNGGAEGLTYFSDHVTHCIVGDEPVDTDISDANDLYEVPAVSQEWVTYSLKCKKLLPTSAFKGGEKLLFTGVVASFSKLSEDDSKKLWAMLKYYGGTYNSTFSRSTTHLIVSKPEGQKYEQALKCSDIIHVVTPDWMIDSVRTNSLCAEILYHPRLLIIEKPQMKADYQSTAHITGFADDVVPDETPSGVVPSSEILQQLKLRMPWNQPNQTVSSASSTPGPLASTTVSMQKLMLSGGVPQPRPVSSLLSVQPSRTTVPQVQHQMLQQRALQQPRPMPEHWRPQTRNQIQQPQPSQQQQQPQLGQKPGLQLSVLQQQIHQQQQQQPIQQQGVHQQTIQQPQQHLQQHLAMVQQKSLLQQQQQQQQSSQQHFIVHDSQQQNGSQQPQAPTQPQQQQQMMPQMVQHQVVQQQQSFVTLSNNNQMNWTQQQQQQQFQLRQQQLQQLQQPPQQQPQRQITWSQQPQQQGPARQLIHMDAATHAQLQQMDPQQRALFLHNLQKQRQIALQRQMQQQQQQQQRQAAQLQQGQQVGGAGGGPTVVFSGGRQPTVVIRGQIPPGLTHQQQLQWLQQQKQQQQQQQQQLAMQQQLRQQAQQQPERQMGSQQLSQPQQPVMQSPSWAHQGNDSQLQGQGGPGQQQMAQLRQQQQQQLQLHRFQQLQQQKQQQAGAGGVRLAQPMIYTNQMGVQGTVTSQPSLPNQPLTETSESVAVASSSDIFSMTNSVGVEGSAAGQLRLMTAQHHAQQLQPPTPSPAPSPLISPAPPMRGGVTQGRVGVGVGVALKTECVRDVTPPAAKPPYNTQTAARVAAVLAKSAAATQPPQHHQRPQFFGHNPNIKLPPDMFLLGCIFLIVEYDRTGDNTAEWTRCITKYGGEVESSYTLRVTHVICQTQKHPLVQQGMRDAKRCVTAEWLSDVCLKQQVLPPWLALHFPTPYSEEKPCRNFIISYSGFEGEERNKVKKMIETTGGKITSYFTSHNNILVCRRPEGDKYKRAREWGKSVVNVQWLNEILFGHYSCLQQPDSHKYQQYNLGNPFRIDYILVPHLMAAWKVPLNVTQEAYDRVKANPTPTLSRKRPRMMGPQYSNTADKENKDCMMDGIEVINPNPPPPDKRPVILFSGAYGQAQKEEAKKVLMLGGALTHNANEATHLIMAAAGCTLKLYCCVTTCKYIVTPQWLTDSFAHSTFLSESSYIYSNPELEKQYNFKLTQTLQMPHRRNLFRNKKFFLTPGIVPGRLGLKQMIELAGGTVDRQRKSLKFMQDQDPLTYFVISVPKDYHLVSDVLRSSLGVYSTDFVVTCLLRQSVEHEAVTMAIRRPSNRQGR